MDEARSLLEELVGLGVLVRLDNGTYRLRNANVVRALGSESEILERLGELSNRSAPAEFDPRTLRACLDSSEGTWSPLTLEQEASLTRGQAGLGFVFGSEALGFAALQNAVHRLVARPEQPASDGGLVTVPADCLSVRSLQAFLEKRLSGRETGRFIIYMDGSQLLSFAEHVSRVITELTVFLKRRRSRKRSIHAIVGFDAPSTAKWCLRTSADRLADEDRVDVATNANTWGPEMVERFLVRHGMMSTKTIAQTLMEATGGWPFLIWELFAELQRAHGDALANVDPRNAAKAVASRVSSTSEESERFLNAVGLQYIPEARPILNVVCEFETVNLSDLTPNVIDCPSTSDEGIASSVAALVKLGVLKVRGNSLQCDVTVRRALSL